MHINRILNEWKRVLVRTLFLVLFWALTFPLLWSLTSKSSLHVDQQSYNSLAKRVSPDTEFGAFMTVYFNLEQDHRPEYAISFKTLRLSNRSLGFLRTALHKTVHVENLKYIVYSYAEESKALTDNLADDKKVYNSLACEDVFSVSEQLRRLSASSEGRYIHIPDISKATQIDINDFMFKWCREQHGELSVQGRRAVFVAEEPDKIMLLGRVILSTPSRIYEASRVVWNVEKHCFQIKGRTFVSTADGKHIEQDIWLDYNLNILDDESNTKQPKGGSLCLASKSCGD